MEYHLFIAFVTATIIMISLPGPSLLLAVAHSLTYGWRPALATVAGETAGVAVQLVVAAAGLTSLLQGVAGAFEYIRWGGAAYLVYLGIRQWQGADQPLEITAPAVSGRHLFVQGLVVTIRNPKSLIFIAAFLPQFLDASRPLGLQFAVIVPTFLIITFTVASLWTVAAGRAGMLFRQRKLFPAVLRTAGGMMVASGIGLALARRG